MTARERFWLRLATWRALAAHRAMVVRLEAAERLYGWRYAVLAPLLDRFASERMRHCAFLLGFVKAHGYGRGGDGLLGLLPEFAVGNELGLGLRYGRGDELAAVWEEYRLEHARWATAPQRRNSRAGGAL